MSDLAEIQVSQINRVIDTQISFSVIEFANFLISTSIRLEQILIPPSS